MTEMRHFFLVITMAIIPFFVNAQDIIVFQTGDEIIVKVLEVNTDNIKYKKADNLEGPTYTTTKAEIFMIKYANGTKDVFGSSNSKESESNATNSEKKTGAEKSESIEKNPDWKIYQKEEECTTGSIKIVNDSKIIVHVTLNPGNKTLSIDGQNSATFYNLSPGEYTLNLHQFAKDTNRTAEVKKCETEIINVDY